MPECTPSRLDEALTIHVADCLLPAFSLPLVFSTPSACAHATLKHEGKVGAVVGPSNSARVERVAGADTLCSAFAGTQSFTPIRNNLGPRWTFVRRRLMLCAGLSGGAADVHLIADCRCHLRHSRRPRHLFLHSQRVSPRFVIFNLSSLVVDTSSNVRNYLCPNSRRPPRALHPPTVLTTPWVLS